MIDRYAEIRNDGRVDRTCSRNESMSRIRDAERLAAVAGVVNEVVTPCLRHPDIREVSSRATSPNAAI